MMIYAGSVVLAQDSMKVEVSRFLRPRREAGMNLHELVRRGRMAYL